MKFIIKFAMFRGLSLLGSPRAAVDFNCADKLVLGYLVDWLHAKTELQKCIFWCAKPHFSELRMPTAESPNWGVQIGGGRKMTFGPSHCEASIYFHKSQTHFPRPSRGGESNGTAKSAQRLILAPAFESAKSQF